ncbi:MAG: hypothetical protein RLZZ574_2803 [Cyanobacteriota bacterium]
MAFDIRSRAIAFLVKQYAVEVISPTAISQAVRYAIAQPKEVAVNEIVVRPSNQDL